MDSNKTAIETLIYRRQRLDAKYEQIKDLVSGSDESFVELISTTSGKYSKTKVKKLVESLIENLREYMSYKETLTKPYGTKMKPVVLKKKDHEFYEAYFRTMIGLSLYNNNSPTGKYSAPGTWNALNERFISLKDYKESAEMYRDLICFNTIGCMLTDYPSRWVYGVIYDVWTAYETVTDGTYNDLIPKAGKQRAFELMTKEEAALIKEDEKNPGTIARMQYEQEKKWEKEQDEFWEMVDKGEIPDGWDYDPGDIYEKMDELEKEEYIENITVSDDDENVEKWINFFSDKEQFRRDCKLIMENIIDMDNHHDLIDNAKNALQLYLAKSGITKWLIDDDYFTIYTYLNKALKASKKVVER